MFGNRTSCISRASFAASSEVQIDQFQYVTPQMLDGFNMSRFAAPSLLTFERNTSKVDAKLPSDCRSEALIPTSRTTIFPSSCASHSDMISGAGGRASSTSMRQFVSNVSLADMLTSPTI